MVGIVSTTQATAATARKGGVQPAQLLQLLGNDITGRFTVYAAGADIVPWRIYVSNGQIHYSSSVLGQKERLTYFLHKFTPQIAALADAPFSSDYDLLCQAWQSGQLDFRDLRNIIFAMTQDALMHVLKMPELEISFEKGLFLDPILLSAPVRDLLVPVKAEIQQWTLLHSIKLSPFHRVVVKNPAALEEFITLKSASAPDFRRLSALLTSEHCLFEVATQLSVSTLELCQFLQPHFQTGIVQTMPFRQTQSLPVIACIDDSKTVQRNVRMILKASGYEVLELMDPSRALTTLVRNKPALILMDISMPGIDGYELCRMLRSTNFLKDVPIIMLTGRDGVVDRLRARMVGANDYLTKPCGANQLVSMIQKLLSVETTV